MTSSSDKTRTLRPETQLVHGGTLRSEFGEMSEALFLTQGYAYHSAEQAERRFTGEEPGFQYSRFSNPTVAMFEERMRLLEGAEEARACATGMARGARTAAGATVSGDQVQAAARASATGTAVAALTCVAAVAADPADPGLPCCPVDCAATDTALTAGTTATAVSAVGTRTAVAAAAFFL